MIDNRQRLFEIMERVNPEFINEAGVIGNAFRSANNAVFGAADKAAAATVDKAKAAISNKLGDNFQLRTYGDLNKAINVITGVKKGELVGAELSNVGVDFLLGLLPGLSAAKSAMDVYSAMFKAPDDKKTNTWLDKLNVDDDLSAIVDDTVETGFMTELSQLIANEPPTKPLEPNFDINAKMVDFLSRKYNKRTVAGVPPKV